MKMNAFTHARGRKRDLKVLAHLEVLNCLSQEHIHLLEFWNVSREMSYRCTQRLERGKYIKREESMFLSFSDWFYLYDFKRPKQVHHQLGKAWIYTALKMRELESNSQEEIIYLKSEESQFLPLVKPDIYAVSNHKENGKNHIFTEFQITEFGNGFKKQYKKLFSEFDPSERLTLIVVTTGSYDSIKKSLTAQLAEFKNVKLEFYTLDKLKEYTWRIAEEMRNKFRQQLLNDRKEIMTWEFGKECGKQQVRG